MGSELLWSLCYYQFGRSYGFFYSLSLLLDDEEEDDDDDDWSSIDRKFFNPINHAY